MVGHVSCYVLFFFFQAEDGIRDLVRSRGLGDVYKRQPCHLLDFPRIDSGNGDHMALSSMTGFAQSSGEKLSLIHI